MLNHAVAPGVRACAAAVALAAGLHAAPASAQVNVETFRSDLDARRHFLSLQASYAGHTGNTRGSVASASVFGGFIVDRSLFFAKAAGDYAQFSGNATIAKTFAHVRYNYRILPFLYGELFAQAEYNKFQRLALRQLDGLGLRVALLERPDVQLAYGSAFMFDYEKLSQDPGTFAPPPDGQATYRWSNYASASWKLRDRTLLSDVLYVQPRIDDFTAYRLLNDASFVIDLDKRFSAKVGCQVHHDSRPPPRVYATDVDTITSLLVTF